MSGGGAGGVIAVGSCGAPDGTSKAAVLTLNAMGAWQPTLLPGLGAEPAAGNFEAFGHMEDIACGVAQDDGGNDKPVVWSFDAALQDWNPPIELPLLPGGSQGLADNGLVFDDAGTAVTIVVGTSETGGAGTTATHGVLWRQVAGGPWEAPVDLPPLPGMANSKKKGIIVVKPPTGAGPGGGNTIIVVGASYNGPDTDVATRWEIDLSVSPAVVTIHNLNDLVPNLPANLTLGEATAAESEQTGREGTILCLAFDLSGGLRVGATDPHAVILTALPKQGTPKNADYPHDRRKNRYISFDPNKPDNDGTNVAFKVALEAIMLGSCNGPAGNPPQVDFCRTDRGADDCNTCAGAPAENSCINQPIDCGTNGTCTPTGETCVNDAPNSGGSNVGTVWWVGPESPLNNGVHLLVSMPFRKESTNWANPVYAGDCEVVPEAVYGVRAVAVSSGTESDELLVETTLFAASSSSWWGDCVGPLKKFCGGDIRTPQCVSDGDCTVPQTCDRAWTLPDGSVNFDDVNAALALVAPGPTSVAPDTTWVDLHGNATGTPGSQNFDPPNFVLNFSDIGQILSGFGGFPYKGYDPADCPDSNTWP